jgi:Ser/Thr protein kinase RdoA (MazF antagonist)
VKTLPDNPNLDHLRRQAKDLLAGLQDRDPDVPLAEAQALLAEQYGFRSWTELKAEVDRRQDTADVADPALATAIADRFGLGEVTGPMRSLARPDEMGRRWSLHTRRGRWAVRTVDDVYPVSDGEADVALQEAAARAGVLVPAIVRSTSGAVIETIDGHRWRITEWLHSAPPLVAPTGTPITRAVGGILARIHLLRQPVERICPWHSTRFTPIGWPELAAKAAGAGAAWAPVLAEAVPALLDLDAAGAGCPAGAGEPVFTHNNLLPANLRRGGNGRLVVSGWEHAAGQPPAWELSEVLTHWTVDPRGGVNTAGARAMAEGYREVAGALPALSPVAFRGTAISLANYVYGQVMTALSATGAEEQRYAERSVRHLLAHLPTPHTFDLLLTALR